MSLIENESVIESQKISQKMTTREASDDKTSNYLGSMLVNEDCMRELNVSLTDDQVVDLMSNWMMRSTLIISKKMTRPVSSEVIARLLNISKGDAQTALENLANMNLLKMTTEGFTDAVEGFRFDEEFIHSGDLLTIHNRILDLIKSRLRTKDVFGTHFVMSNQRIIQKNIPKIIGFIQSLNDEESQEDACDLYSFDFSILKISSGKGVQNELN